MGYLKAVVLTGLMMVLPRLAAATTYNFSASEVSALSPSPVSFAFALDTATAAVRANGATFSDITIMENGTPVTANSVGAQYGTDLSSPLFFWIDTSLTPFYSVAGADLVFNTGTFAIADGATDGEGTLVISQAGNSAVPEPATWGLLFAGSLLGMGLMRKAGLARGC